MSQPCCVSVQAFPLQSLSIPFQNFYPTILRISLHYTMNHVRPEAHFHLLLTTLFPASGHSGGQGPCIPGT